MDDEDDEPKDGELVSRAPTEEDLVAMCRLLNDSATRYVIIGGFAIMYSGFGRTTGEVEKYTVVRVADEIVVDLMKSASGIDYAEAAKDIIMRVVQGVAIPFASPRLLWRMKKNTHREKDAADLLFLRQQYPEVTVD